MIFYLIVAISLFGLMGGECQLVGEGGGVVIFSVFLSFLLAFFLSSLKRPERKEPEIKQRFKVEPDIKKSSGSEAIFYGLIAGLIIEILTGRL